MKTITVNDAKSGKSYYLLDQATFDGVASTFDPSLLASVVAMPAGGVRDDMNWKEELHKRSSNGQFVGKGGAAATGKKGVNEKHFEAKGVGGDHQLVPKNPKSKSLPHGMTVNQYIAEKHNGDVGKGLSYLKYYHNKGDFDFKSPDKPQPKHEPEVKKGTPLTKGKNAEHYNSLGVTQEHELHAKPSMKSIPKGMTVKQYIDQKHGGDEGKALSWLKHHEKNGDLVIKAPGGGEAVQPKAEEPPTGDSTNPVPAKQVKEAIAKPQKVVLTPEEKEAAKAEAAKAKIYAKFGLTPDHVVAVSGSHLLSKYNHGQALKDNPHAKQDLAGALKHLTQQQNYGALKLVAPGQPIPDKPMTTNEFVEKHGDKVIQTLKPNAPYGTDFVSHHGKTLNDFIGEGYGKTTKVSALKEGLQTGQLKLLDPGLKSPSLDESHAAYLATLSAEQQRAAKRQAKAQAGKAEQEKSFGEASYTPSKVSYHELVGQHLKPTGAHHSAMQAYSGSAFSDINSKLRKGKRDQLSADQRKTVKDLEDFTNKSRLNQDATFYRGVKAEGRASLHMLRPGDDYAPGQFNSVSTSKSVAHSFADGHEHVMVIRAKKGARGGFMGSSSHFKHEHEIVLPHDAKLRYAGRSKEGHWIFDHVE